MVCYNSTSCAPLNNSHVIGFIRKHLHITKSITQIYCVANSLLNEVEMLITNLLNITGNTI